jgi:hypothetical protein
LQPLCTLGSLIFDFKSSFLFFVKDVQREIWELALPSSLEILSLSVSY